MISNYCGYQGECSSAGVTSDFLKFPAIFPAPGNFETASLLMIGGPRSGAVRNKARHGDNRVGRFTGIDMINLMLRLSLAGAGDYPPRLQGRVGRGLYALRPRLKACNQLRPKRMATAPP